MVVLQTGFPYNIATAKCIKEAPKIKIKTHYLGEMFQICVGGVGFSQTFGDI